MDEQIWLTSDDPREMLEFMTNQYNFQVGPTEGRMISDRKLRLFACACCRQVWHLLSAVQRQMYDALERFADSDDEADLHGLWAIPPRTGNRDFNVFIRHLTIERLGADPATQAALLRDIAGNPWRPVARTDGGFVHWI